MMAKRFENPEAFRQALQARLRNTAAERDLAIQDLQLKFVIERLLARLFAVPNPPWILKGGFAMELRYRPHARTTRDVDLTIGAGPGTTVAERLDTIREQLQEAVETDPGDYLIFRIGAVRNELVGAPFGGGRFPVEVLLAGRVFGRFHIDVGIGDPVLSDPEELVGDDLLAFIGVAPARALAVPKSQQFAEKLHAYTFRWTDRQNTRVKDLADLVLLIERGDLRAAEVASAVQETFRRRDTHPVPNTLAPPPEAWAAEFPSMAEQADLSTREIGRAFEILRDYFETTVGSCADGVV